MEIESHHISTLVALGLVLLLAVALLLLRQNRLWREAGREIVRRRPLSMAFLCLYTLLALLGSVSWKGQQGLLGEYTECEHVPCSVLDRMFPADFKEASYSAPLATHELYGGKELRHTTQIFGREVGLHLLGTDIIGRDVLQLALGGARVALLIGGLTTLILIPLALLFGVSAGYIGGRVDDAVVFLFSTLAAMPGLLLLIALITVLGRSPVNVCIALGVTGWVGLCRLVRGETLKLRELDYVRAARALGVSEFRIVWRHVIPNLMHLVVITSALLFSGFVLSEAVLSWLGIGIDGSWGQMIDQAKDELVREPMVWWNLMAAFLALFGLILAVNRVGDAVRDVLDPRTLRENL